MQTDCPVPRSRAPPIVAVLLPSEACKQGVFIVTVCVGSRRLVDRLSVQFDLLDAGRRYLIYTIICSYCNLGMFLFIITYHHVLEP